MGGGGGSKPSWKNIWVPGKPFPPGGTYDEYEQAIGEGLHGIMKEAIEDMGGTLIGIAEHRYSRRRAYRYRFVYRDQLIDVQVEPGDLVMVAKMGRRNIGRYHMADPNSFQNLKDDIDANIPGEPPIKEGCGIVRGIVPVSGGMDSTLLALTHKDADRIYFDYGQAFKDAELLALESFGIAPKIIDIGKQPIDDNGVFKSRNFKFFTALREEYPDEDLVIYFGNNKSDENPGIITDNCSYSICAVSEAIDLMYAGPSFRIESPLLALNYSKGNISDKLEKLMPEGSFVIWCEGHSLMPCGNCHKCDQMREYDLYDFWKARIKIPDGSTWHIAEGIAEDI